MNGIEINKYINKKCYDCCHFKKENLEMYKLNLPNGIINNIIDYALGKEDLCNICRNWRFYQELIKCTLSIKRLNERNVEDDILIFLTVYKLPPYEYVKQFLKVSKKKYEMIYDILRMLCHSEKKGDDIKEYIKFYIEIYKKFNVENTVRDINIIFKMMYEINEICQLNYYPELKL